MVSISELVEEKQAQQFPLYEKYLNQQLAQMLKTLGFDKTYVRAEKQYLYDKDGHRYLDLLSGYGVHSLGRNHPKVIAQLQQVLTGQLANMVQFDCPVLAASFAEKLAKWMPNDVNKFFFCNSGTEAVEGAIKFARAATKRSKILYCYQAFHGLTTGSLALNGSEFFKQPYEPLLPGADMIRFNDLPALEAALKTKEYACFVIEPIQGKGVYIPSDDYFPKASELCKKYQTLLVVDEIQTGIGRTGQFFAHQHWPGTEPDIITMAKALSGGFIPVGVIAMKPWIFNKTYTDMEHAVIHSCTFGRNDMAMAAGIAALEVVEDENLITKAAENGARLLAGLQQRLTKFEMVKEVRGKGMMIGIEFCPPTSFGLKAGWKLLEAANKGLFLQMIVIPLFRDFRMITQVAGYQSYVIKLIPPLDISEQDIQDVIDAFEKVVAEAHRFPGSIWDLGKTLTKQALKAKVA